MRATRRSALIELEQPVAVGGTRPHHAVRLDRAVRIANLWNWLPAFRTVAETQHLRTAARALHVSPSALSRSVKQLEDALDQPLFTREKGRMQLNGAGKALLASVRDAMRRVDDGVAQLGSAGVEIVRVAGQAAWLEQIVLPAVGEPPSGDARVVVEVVELPASDVASSLLRGDLDLALGEAFERAGGIAVEHLGAVAVALYQRGGRAPVADLPFAVCLDGTDAWPPGRARRVALRTRQLTTVVEACEAGLVQAVLPRSLARAHGLRETERFPDSQLYLARRMPLHPSTLDAVVDAIRLRAATALAPERTPHRLKRS